MDKDIKKVVREGYARIANVGSCCSTKSPCCSSKGDGSENRISEKIGYSEEDLKSVPEGSNLGLGCGNPVALASLREGETVLDLGSGAGFDCFIAAKRVGKGGRVIGVDMTPEMIDRAKSNAESGGITNVEFRLGEIEQLPVTDRSVDVIISNCVINLSPDKKSVFEEAIRVLKPGGRMMISDIVLLRAIPESMECIRQSAEAYIGCISGAIIKEDYLRLIEESGFGDVRIIEENSIGKDAWSDQLLPDSIIEQFDIPPEDLEDFAKSIISIKVQAIKPIDR
ncbi:MAG TPA: arsenite methyltransferase [Euryarchaeota archaeon]|nr:arsenite methyltransferase [Euryarchaeota archaeon]